MKTLLFTLLTLLLLNQSFSQIFDFTTDWFQHAPFFDEATIKQHKISSIEIWSREKKDGKHLQVKQPLSLYSYNKKGLITKSKKWIASRNDFDTAVFIFSYNDNNKLFKREEKQGVFFFSYTFFYENGFLKKEIKINENVGDTAYLRYYETTIRPTEKRVVTQNSIYKPFLINTEKSSKGGLLLSQKTSYVRNQNFSKSEYQYKDDRLILKKEIDYYGKKTTKETLLEYKNEELQKLNVKLDNQLKKKFAFTYFDNGLPKEIIERNVDEKTIVIYELLYSFQD